MALLNHWRQLEDYAGATTKLRTSYWSCVGDLVNLEHKPTWNYKTDVC